MFCHKCGQENPETGKFCRSCGTDLGNVTGALTASQKPLVDRKGRPIGWDGAITKFFTGFAFLAVAIALGVTGFGKGWWFWFLIPAFGSIGSGVAQYVQLKKAEKGLLPYTPQIQPNEALPGNDQSLPAQRPTFLSPESRYKTGDLVPPSVTDNTTRHLEMDTEGKTMTLPKK